MGCPSRYTARAKRIRPLFEPVDDEFSIQLARLIVLYEDLRIEVAGSVNREIPGLDETGRQYRKLYFVRRAFATIDEIRGALNQINSTTKMKALRSHLSEDSVAEWMTALQFFNEQAGFVGDQRNLYGGHFLYKTAKFALAHLSSATVGVVGIEKSQIKRSAHVVFKFALELVGIGLTADRAEEDIQQFAQRNFDVLTTAMRHATTAIHIVSDHHILKPFGFL